MGPHDGRYKLFFSYRRMVEDLIRGFLREPWLQGLDPKTLEPMPADFVDPHYRQRLGDCLWRARVRRPNGTSTYCYILLEFQSKPDRYMPLRLLGYEVLLLERLVHEHQLAAGRALPLLVAIVLGSGTRPWNIPLELRELFTPAPEGAERLLPGLSYLLIDRARMATEALDQPDNLAAAFFRIEAARSPEDLLSLARPLARMLPVKREPELRKAFTKLLVETFRTAFPGVTISPVGDLEELHMLEENMIRWHNSVLREGRRQGVKEGRKQGAEKGKAEGQVAGIQRVLLKQMKLRFGTLPLAVRREIRGISSLAKLEDLAGRLLTAGSLSELGLGQG